VDGILVSRKAKAAAHLRRHAAFYLVGILLASACVWQLLSLRGFLRGDTWPAPSVILHQLWHDLFHAPSEMGDQNSTMPVIKHITLTLAKWALGFTASVIIGASVGFSLGASRTVFALGYPVVNVLRSLPSAAVWPLCVIVLGLSLPSQISVIVFGALWPVLLSTVNSLSALPQEVRDSLEFMQLSRLQRMITQLRWSLPGIFTGVEISCSVAFLLTITVEIFHPGNGGIGWYVFSATNTSDAPTAFAGLLLTAILGWLLNTAIYQLRRYVLFWEHGAHERPRPVQALLARLRRASAATLLSKVTDPRLRQMLLVNYVTAEVRQQFGEGNWKLRVLYNELKPYIWPTELRQFGDKPVAMLQRDIVIEARVDGTSALRPILFAQSWIDLSKVSKETNQSLQDGRVTLGDAIMVGETDIRYEDVWYRSVVSDRLGRVLASSGSVETIQRCRKILIHGVPAVLVHEYVPILLGNTTVFV